MRRAGWLVGAPLVALGAWLVLESARGGALLSVGTWVAGGVVVHDLVVAPVVVGVGLLLLRVVPGRVRAYVQGALVVTATLAVVTLPLVLGGGRVADVPSQQPLPYGRDLAVVVTAVWLVAAVLAALRLRRDRRAAPTAPEQVRRSAP